MPEGTTFKEFFVPRLHRSNASEKLQEAQEMQQYAREQLIALACAAPHHISEEQPWTDYAPDRVRELLDTYGDMFMQEITANRLLEDPETAVDDLDRRPSVEVFDYMLKEYLDEYSCSEAWDASSRDHYRSLEDRKGAVDYRGCLFFVQRFQDRQGEAKITRIKK